MLFIALMFIFLFGFCMVLGFFPLNLDNRPRLKLQTFDFNAPPTAAKAAKKATAVQGFFNVVRKISILNKPLASPAIRQRISKDLMMGKVEMTVEEFLLIKQLCILVLMWAFSSMISNPETSVPMAGMCLAVGYLMPDWWLKGRIKKIKDSLLKDLPDTVDLLALCVNAGLDFMMALKYLVEKSPPSVIMEELANMMQEINVGKPRREALRSLAKKYELSDLSTFSRTLIQADRMGTSVSEALNILSEDMRETRYRRGEAMALKAPLKMLIPLLLFIFPVVGILVAGPIFLEFFTKNPLSGLAP
jgi:pilus assembly protein TadC